jgi:hypothetical protein
VSQAEVAKLRGLLERVQRNAGRPRVAAPVVVASAAPEAIEEATIADDIDITAEQPAPSVPVPPAPPPVMAAEPMFDEPEAAPELEVVELELGEEEIVDITDVDDIQEIPEAPTGLELSVEEPPASSRRPIATNMSEALAGAADSAEADVDEGREIPLKTPPPESGPQAAPPMSPAASTAELDELIGEPIVHPPAPAHAIVDEHAPSGVIEVAERVEPQIIARTAARAAQVSAIVRATRSFQPQSFAELLDASLGLGD